MSLVGPTRSVIRYLACAAALSIAGCAGPGGPGVGLDGELAVSPKLIDLGTSPVGGTTTNLVQVSATVANVQVFSVSTLNVTGDFFTATGDFYLVDSETNTSTLVTEDPLVIERNTSLYAEILYAPTAEGYHQATVRVSHGGVGGESSAQIRARADTPSAGVFPWVVDFGQVLPGEIKEKTVTVVNESDIPLTIESPLFEGGSGFDTPETFPFTVDGGSANTEIRLSFSLEDGLQPNPAYGTAKLLVGTETLQNLTLRANDCENGIPSAYDEDSDGFTTCGGDCDDTNPLANPSGQETIIDGADNDCDGLIDNNTAGYDDDGDGYCDHPATCIESTILPGDCNDGDPNVSPAENEIAGDGIDNDCDGSVDAGTQDFDLDGYTEAAGDCDPNNPATYPDAFEIPDGEDNDCDTLIDEGTVLYDDDGDNFCEGLPGGNTPCSDGSILGDCDDSTSPTGVPGSASNPTQTEVWDGVDNDCDGFVDEDTEINDDDGDGYSENSNPADCDDGNPSIGPSSLEIPNNGIDDDCDASTPASGPQ